MDGLSEPSLGLHPVCGSPGDPTKLLQRINSILHVDPEAQPPQGDGVVGDGQRELGGRAVDLLRTTHKKYVQEKKFSSRH